MAKVFDDFREIVAWQLAHQMKLRVELFLGCPDFRKHFKFCEQLSDAARSGPRNIAEGHGQFNHKAFAQLVRIARGSEAEVLNHLIDAQTHQRLISADELTINERLAKRAMRAAGGLIRYLESTPDPPPGSRDAVKNPAADPINPHRLGSSQPVRSVPK